MRKTGIVVGLVILVGCADEPRANETLTDEQAIAMVNKMNEPPVIPLRPDAITRQDVIGGNLEDIACGFVQPSDADPIFVAGPEKGWLKLDGRIVELVADRSSDAVASLPADKYIGLRNWLTLSRQRENAGEDGSTSDLIVIHNAHEKVVFRGGGSLRCGTEAAPAFSSSGSAEPGLAHQGQE